MHTIVYSLRASRGMGAYGDKEYDFSKEDHEKFRIILESLRKVQSHEEDKNEIEED